MILKLTHMEQMEEKIQVFDFALADEDMAAIAALDKKEQSSD